MMIKVIKEKGPEENCDYNLKGDDLILENKQGGMHQYSLEERVTYAKMLNNIFSKDEDLKDRIPMDTEDDTLFHIFQDGIVLPLLMIAIDSDCIDRRAIEMKENMNVFEIR